MIFAYSSCCDLCPYQDDMNYGGVCLFSMSLSSLIADVVPVGEGCERRINYHPT